MSSARAWPAQRRARASASASALPPRLGLGSIMGTWPSRAAPFRDLGRVVRAVHEIVEIGDAPRRDGRQRKRHLAVVHRRRCQQARNRNIAVGGVDVQLIANPARLVAFGVAFCADGTCRWKIGQHRGQRHVDLTLQSPWLLRWSRLALFWPTTLALRRFFGRRGSRRLLARLDRRRVARYVPDEAILVRLLNQRLVRAARQPAPRKFGEGARKRTLAGDTGRALPPA